MSKKEQKITKDELLTKITREQFKIIEGNVYCQNCGTTTIVDYIENISVNDLGDTVLRGKCIKCGAAVARYLETGELAN